MIKYVLGRRPRVNAASQLKFDLAKPHALRLCHSQIPIHTDTEHANDEGERKLLGQRSKCDQTMHLSRSRAGFHPSLEGISAGICMLHVTSDAPKKASVSLTPAQSAGNYPVDGGDYPRISDLYFEVVSMYLVTYQIPVPPVTNTEFLIDLETIRLQGDNSVGSGTGNLTHLKSFGFPSVNATKSKLCGFDRGLFWNMEVNRKKLQFRPK